MIRRIAEKLMIRVYYEFSAVVSLDDQGRVIGISLFDTVYGGKWMKAEPEAAALWLLINHPAGNIALAQQDMENIAALKEAMPFTPLRVFVTGEDIGVREAAL